LETNFLAHIHLDPQTATLAVSGELDLASAPEFDAALTRTLDSPASSLIIDLSALEFIDSTGVRALLKGYERATGDGRRCSVVNGGPQVSRILEMTGVDRQLKIPPGANVAPPPSAPGPEPGPAPEPEPEPG
jgi:anti-anti-sigma factor